MSSQNKLRIVIADDHPVFRYGLRQIIEAEEGFDIVGESGDGLSALQITKALRPEIVILDVSMPNLDGLTLAQQILEEALPVKIILVTMYREEKLFKQALEIGVKGYVLKDSAATDIISCIKAVVAGQNYTSPELTTYLVNRVQKVNPSSPLRTGLEGLTIAELRVLSLLADYKTSKEIAQDLSISPRTVDTHRNNICQKLDIHGSHALMKFALKHKDSLPQL